MRSAIVTATLLLLIGFAAIAQDLQSSKAPDYTKAPKHILVQIAPGGVPVEDFRTAFALFLAHCGTSVRFASPVSLADVKSGGFDSVMSITPLREEKTTISTRFYTHTYISNVFELTLVDIETGRNVWKAEIGLSGGDNPTKAEETHREQKQAARLFKSMMADGLMGSCKPNGTLTVSVPDDLTFRPNPAAAASSPPSRSADYTVRGKKYATVEAALDAIRQIVDQKVEKAMPVDRQTYPSVLVIIPTPAQFSSIKIPESANRDDFIRFFVGASDIQYEAYIRAFRKTQLFESVDTARSDEVAADDFRGHAYKLWFTSPGQDISGSWVLASAKGEERRFQITAPDHDVDVGAMLMRADFALDNLPR